MREYRRQVVVRAAVDAADRIIMSSSDGTVEMTNRLTATVSIALLQLVSWESFGARTSVGLDKPDITITEQAIATIRGIIDSFPEKELAQSVTPCSSVLPRRSSTRSAVPSLENCFGTSWRTRRNPKER
jgi:hypothetical protein